jgi:hypothetical protein
MLHPVSVRNNLLHSVHKSIFIWTRLQEVTAKNYFFIANHTYVERTQRPYQSRLSPALRVLQTYFRIGL